ncbi:hypothetical protein C7974DRAFT_225029 [Boeremia exigua]|uniref:uncharacterized protein n=1 Tax=Boeremia exigua TaxID=749465 RepID=UPI001E8D6CCB|nr:uncharacterized protein C7974DRAFT_225029 [Boeremia exigua]KAH6620043.1 hypothetical protein C7974DRAFT_225029 [Boeremia exigua]
MRGVTLTQREDRLPCNFRIPLLPLLAFPSTVAAKPAVSWAIPRQGASTFRFPTVSVQTLVVYRPSGHLTVIWSSCLLT